MMYLNDKNFRQYQLAMLEILKEIRRICTEHNLKYFLAFGTLLGAIRHGGFIPWDYDADVEMLREDYEKFIIICASELNENFFLSTPRTDKKSISPHARLCLNNTKVVFALFENSVGKGHQGIFVDIFPIDVVPQLCKKQNRHMRKNRFLRSILLLKIRPKYSENLYRHNAKGRFSQSMKSVAKSILRFAFLPLPISTILRWMDKNAIKYLVSGSTLRAYVLSARPYTKSIIDENLYMETITAYFENEPFTIVSRYEDYLALYYKNYKEIPSKEEQNISRNSVIDVVFCVDSSKK